VLEEARGNVLFIDEAYSLYDGSGDRKDFWARVIDSLLTVLSQPDPDMLIVFAGYEKEMDAMLNTNPGLMGRFPYKYRFADYDADQLMEIAKRLLERDDYILTDEAASVLRASIVMTLGQRTPNFGNARWIEQYIVGGIIPAMANRIAATGSDDYQHVETCDVRSAYEKFNPKATELKPRRKVGFSS
jgi:SpoVK/Ycf46/Vps4 family AAA+-type ATPase